MPDARDAVQFAGMPILTIDLGGIAAADRPAAYRTWLSAISNRQNPSTLSRVRIEPASGLGLWKVSITPPSGPDSTQHLLVVEQFDEAFEPARVTWTALVSTDRRGRSWTSVGADAAVDYNIGTVFRTQMRSWLETWLPGLRADDPLRSARIFVYGVDITPALTNERAPESSAPAGLTGSDVALGAAPSSVAAPRKAAERSSNAGTGDPAARPRARRDAKGRRTRDA